MGPEHMFDSKGCKRKNLSAPLNKSEFVGIALEYE